MYYDEDEGSPLHNHVRKEQILSLNNYNALSLSLNCDEDTVAYRGLSFRTKAEYDQFKILLDSGEYKPNYPESYSREKKTAEEFARNKKTFFFYQDNNIALENTYKNISNEKISVYAGIVIETIIPKGMGVDVNKSNEGIEDEIIYQNSDNINYKYEILESFETQLKNNPIDINQYIQDKGVKDPLSKYIMSNHQNELTKNTQLSILNEILNPIKIKENKTSYYIDESDKNVVATESDNSLIENDRINIRFHFSPILQFYKNGVFNDPTVLAVLEKSANKIIEEVCEFIESEYNYGEREESVYYDLSYVNETSHLADEKHRIKLKNTGWMSTPKHYDDINNEIRELNYRDDLSVEEKNKMFQGKADEIKDFLLNRINGVPKDKPVIEKEIEKQKSKNDDIKKRIKKLRNNQ